jgi:sulfite reductase alpha subunit-like flavoprotein
MLVPEFLRHPLTLETLATEYWDLNAMPRSRVFELLALNCNNELEKEKLIDFTTPAGQEELYGYVNRPRRTVLEVNQRLNYLSQLFYVLFYFFQVLNDFPHAMSAITLQTLLEIFAPIKPRSFSIASSPKSETLDLLVAVVEYRTILKVTRKGLCSNWLKNLAVNDRVWLGLKKGTFSLPKDQV